MSQLKALISKIDSVLDHNPNGTVYALTITDLNTNKVIARNKLATEIIAENENIETYLNNFHDAGKTNLSIQLRTKNGNGFKNNGEVVLPTPIVQNLPNVPNTDVHEKKKKKKKKKDFSGLGLGLNAMDIMGLKSKADRVDSFLEENKELKSDYKALKKEYETVKEQLLEKKYTSDNADSKNAMITEGLKVAPAVLPMLLAAIKEAANPGSGLATPAPVDEPIYTEVQQVLVKNIPMIDDSVIKVLNVIATKIVTRQEGDSFTGELMQLLKQHEISIV